MTPNRKDFTRALEDLGKACGENSLITIGDHVSQLVHFTYQPSSSIRDHSVEFCEKYLALKYTLDAQDPEDKDESISISSFLAAILFLKSFRLDQCLNPLIQSSHDIKPFRFDRVYDRMLAEDTRRQSEPSETAYSTSLRNGKVHPDHSSRRANQRGSGSNKPINQGTPRPAVPTKRQPNDKPKPHRHSNLAQIERTIENLTKELRALKAKDSLNAVKEGSDSSEANHLDSNTNEDLNFFIDECAVYSTSSPSHNSLKVIYNSGATCSTVSKKNLLSKVKPHDKQINTFGGHVQITDVGKLKLGRIFINPV